jgi:hypothetical protein
MREYFEEQLKDCKIITEKNLEKLKGKSFYGEYQVGDRLLVFLEQETNVKKQEILLTLRSVVERELSQFEKDFKFIRISNILPVFERFKWQE